MSSPIREVRKRSQTRVPTGYAAVLADVKQLIADSRHRALATVNRELVYLYWHIGRVLCKTADHAQVRLALNAAARKIGVATCQTALPDPKLICARLAHFAWPREGADE